MQKINFNCLECGKTSEEEEAKCDLCVRGDAVEVMCLDCSAFLCSRCFDNHKYSKEYQNHNTMPLKLQSEKVVRKCQEHELELIFYCETCDQLVCQYCIVRYHIKHDHDIVKKMATKHRKELDKIMEPVEKMIEGLSVAHREVSNMRDKIRAQADDIDEEIDKYYEELHRRLQQQRDKLTKELHEVSRKKKKKANLQLEQMEHMQARLVNIKELNSAIKNGSDQDALLMKKQLVDDVKRISDSYNKLNTQVATLEFVPVEEYKKSMPLFAYLSYGDVCPGNCEAIGILEMVHRREHVKFKIVTKDQNNHLCQKGVGKVVVQAQSSRGDITPVEVKDNKDGSYSASFVANHVGEVKLSVTLKGQHIKGSPFNVKVYANYTTVDKPSKVLDADERMGAPWGITFGREGMWAVGDNNKHRVWIFDRHDQLIRKFGTKGSGSGEFNRPVGVAFDANNDLYVTDHYNHRVQKFDVTGVYMFQFGAQGSGSGCLKRPVGILIHRDKVYVSQWTMHLISVFQLDGQFSHIIESDHLYHPHYMAVNANDHLLVTNIGSHCISMFTLDGNYVDKFGTHGTGRGELNEPLNIAIDIHGFILVIERVNNRVSIFNKDGVFVHSFGSGGPGLGQFAWPNGLAISPTGDIYTGDTSNGRVQIFST